MLELLIKDEELEKYCESITKDKNIEIVLRQVNNEMIGIRMIKSRPKPSRKKIRQLLLDLKFNMYSLGTNYLVDAIMILLKKPILIRNLNKLYEEVGKLYNKKGETIKRSIIGVIVVMNNKITPDQLRSFFYIYTNERVSPKYFFTIICECFNVKVK